MNDSSPDAAMSEDDRLIEQIHEEVVAGELKRNLVSILKILEAGNPK